VSHNGVTAVWSMVLIVAVSSLSIPVLLCYDQRTNRLYQCHTVALLQRGFEGGSILTVDSSTVLLRSEDIN